MFDKSKFLETSKRTFAYCPPSSLYCKTVLDVFIPSLKGFAKEVFIDIASAVQLLMVPLPSKSSSTFSWALVKKDIKNAKSKILSFIKSDCKAKIISK